MLHFTPSNTKSTNISTKSTNISTGTKHRTAPIGVSVLSLSVSGFSKSLWRLTMTAGATTTTMTMIMAAMFGVKQVMWRSSLTLSRATTEIGSRFWRFVAILEELKKGFCRNSCIDRVGTKSTCT
jgi:hypothetical protein